jgi:hypothetical protein
LEANQSEKFERRISTCALRDLLSWKDSRSYDFRAVTERVKTVKFYLNGIIMKSIYAHYENCAVSLKCDAGITRTKILIAATDSNSQLSSSMNSFRLRRKPGRNAVNCFSGKWERSAGHFHPLAIEN